MAEVKLRVGDKVLVMCGCYKDMEGTVESVYKNYEDSWNVRLDCAEGMGPVTKPFREGELQFIFRAASGPLPSFENLDCRPIPSKVRLGGIAGLTRNVDVLTFGLYVDGQVVGCDISFSTEGGNDKYKRRAREKARAALVEWLESLERWL